MLMSYYTHRIIVADQTAQTRNLVSEVLRGGGFVNILHVRDGKALLDATVEHQPRIVITTSRLPGVSGLEFTRMIREGYLNVPRNLSIIAMTDTPTKAFLEAAQNSGVDEMLVRPFTAQAILLRVRAVLDHPREFIDSAKYIGPCRRRRMVEDYIGPMRRFIDPTEDMAGAPPWESEPNRKAVRMCVQKISENVADLTPGDRRKLRDIYAAVKETEAKADEMLDVVMGAASRSLGRYIMAVGANGVVDPEVVTTHIDAMHTLGLLGSTMHSEREKLVDGLQRIVDKKLGRRVA
jgi:DNA-binding response OmpR family regulator